MISCGGGILTSNEYCDDGFVQFLYLRHVTLQAKQSIRKRRYYVHRKVTGATEYVSTHPNERVLGVSYFMQSNNIEGRRVQMPLFVWAHDQIHVVAARLVRWQTPR